MKEETPIIKINALRMLIFLCATTIVLVILSVWGQAIKYAVVSVYMGGKWKVWKETGVELLTQSFFMDWEANVPTYFNTIILFIPALLMGIIAVWKYSVKDQFKIHWAGLAFILLYLSMDEASVLHEKLIKPMRGIVNYEGYGGILFFAWIIPGIIAVALFMLAYLKFFLSLDRKFKMLFFFSLALYVGGVIGGEMLSGRLAETIGQKNFTYAAYTSLEESLELFGAAMLIYSLLAYLRQYLPNGVILKIS